MRCAVSGRLTRLPSHSGVLWRSGSIDSSAAPPRPALRHCDHAPRAGFEKRIDEIGFLEGGLRSPMRRVPS